MAWPGLVQGLVRVNAVPVSALVWASSAASGQNHKILMRRRLFCLLFILHVNLVLLANPSYVVGLVVGLLVGHMTLPPVGSQSELASWPAVGLCWPGCWPGCLGFVSALLARCWPGGVACLFTVSLLLASCIVTEVASVTMG